MDLFGAILELLPDPSEQKHNKFTNYMGKAIRSAREEAGVSQEELARIIYKRRATLSDIENGKVEVEAGTLSLLSYYLKKPLSYFYPAYMLVKLDKEEFSPLEHELLLHFEQLLGDEQKKLAIQLVKAIEESDAEKMALELLPYAQLKQEQRKTDEEADAD